MSNLSQFVSSGIGTSLTVNTFTVTDLRYCGTYTPVIDNPLGTRVEGGFVICRSSNNAWIVSPRCSEVSRTWYCRDDASTVANLCTSCTGWFVPTSSQLQNPGYTCITYWDLVSSTSYWSSTEINATRACRVDFTSGNAFGTYKTSTCCVRAFRCVTY
jgi:hypothetical protein